MIHGESYKPIVAEAAKKSADKVYNRIMVTHLLMDENKNNRVAIPQPRKMFNYKRKTPIWNAQKKFWCQKAKKRQEKVGVKA